MKSIKEKAKEYLEQNKDEILCVYDRYAGFVDSANYVLEEIENLVKTTLGDGEDYHYNFYIGLVNLCEQLKK